MHVTHAQGLMIYSALAVVSTYGTNYASIGIRGRFPIKVSILFIVIHPILNVLWINFLLTRSTCVSGLLGGVHYQTHSALSWDYALWMYQILQFDWSICVTCVCIIRGSGIMLVNSVSSYNLMSYVVHVSPYKWYLAPLVCLAIGWEKWLVYSVYKLFMFN